ncbi:hypothetical protein CEXT_223861 [Caerostris extrusa]|uniref:Uncharacterized protein n=1 Tax=Caerostris extrusa TaxID=172846 RepID=A0AAV4MUX1_CAEEX|nr:hypothetical protein CEXT_223861 [Caerostris extrusa]
MSGLVLCIFKDKMSRVKRLVLMDGSLAFFSLYLSGYGRCKNRGIPAFPWANVFQDKKTFHYFIFPLHRTLRSLHEGGKFLGTASCFTFYFGIIFPFALFRFWKTSFKTLYHIEDLCLLQF